MANRFFFEGLRGPTAGITAPSPLQTGGGFGQAGAGTTGSSAARDFSPFLFALSDAFSAYQQGKAAKAIAKDEQRVAQFKAEDALKRGQKAVARTIQRTKKVVGRQRASFAAQSIRVGAGSALDVQLETADISEFDRLTILANAGREAFGFQQEGIAARLRGKLAFRAGQTQALDTILSSGATAAKSALPFFA